MGWTVIVEDKCWELGKHSPAGEDYWFSLLEKDVVKELLNHYEGFDTDTEEHVMMLMEAKNNGLAGVPSLKVLVEDADAIEDMIEELYDALYDVEEKYYEEVEKDGT